MSSLRMLAVAIFIMFMASLPASGAAPAGHFSYTATSDVVIDSKTGRVWQRSVSGTKYSWIDAISYCSSVALTLGGEGWRLPTTKELLSLIDYAQPVPPLVDGGAFPNTPVDRFWANTPYNKFSSGSVDYSNGGAYVDLQTATHFVRCVR